MRSLTVPAPAKLNLFLHVTGRRDDGYHLLETLFVALDCGRHDHADASRRRRDRAHERAAGVAPRARSRGSRGARAASSETACPCGVDIAVDEAHSAGRRHGRRKLGRGDRCCSRSIACGSSNLPRAELMRIGVALGADVPFFLGGEPALARGIGERLTPVSLPAFWVGVIVPPIAVPTAAIFAAPELTRNAASAKIEVFSEGYGRNDLQPVAVARFPGSPLRSRSSGRSFGWRADDGFRRSACSRLSPPKPKRAPRSTRRPPAMQGFVARTLARHPLAAFA